MKKTLVWALMATVLMAGSAFAGLRQVADASPGSPGAATFFTASGPSTTNNDDSCDISVAPAATLLLPYFEVDFNAPATTAQTTLFTITNVSQLPQIAHITVWTDLSFPVLDFNIFLTGYDVQAINMYDILNRGVIAPTSGTSNLTTPGSRSLLNNQNPNFLASAATQCAVLPGNIPPSILQDIRTGLTAGTYSTCGTNRIGLTHTNAIGYVTIDVSATCSTTLPIDATYYTGEILFDNVFIGDYQQINPNPATGNYAGGNPLVHIRAVPEGGGAGLPPVPTNLPYTFYDRYTNTGIATVRTVDRRQPLPSVFAARYIQGGTGAFNTNYKIWREGVTGSLQAGTAACAPAASNVYPLNGAAGTAMRVIDLVRFDEHENPTTLAGGVIISPFPSTTVVLPETSSTSTSAGIFPPMSAIAGDVAGWMYLNLNNGGSTVYSVTQAAGATAPAVGGSSAGLARDFRTGSSTSVGPRQNQDWVIVSLFAEGRFSVDFDAAWLGNGCSISPAVTGAANPIGPTGGTPVCPPGGNTTQGGGCVGTNLTP